MKSMKQYKELAQSILDSYAEGEADETTITTLLDVAQANGQMLDNVAHMKWFRDAVADELASHTGCIA